MSEYTRGHIERIEEAYEFMLAYAAQGRTDEGDGPDGAHIRTFLAQFEAGVTAIAGELDTLPGATGEAAAFLDALRADSAIVTSVSRIGAVPALARGRQRERVDLGPLLPHRAVLPRQGAAALRQASNPAAGGRKPRNPAMKRPRATAA